MAPHRRRPPPPSLLIFVGLYQEELVRFRVASIDDEEDPNHFRLQQIQSDHVQRGAINVLRNHGSVLAVGGADGRVVILDVEKDTSWDVALPNEESVNSLDFSGCGRMLFVGGAERSLFHVDIGKRAVTCRKWNVHRSGVVGVRVRPPACRIMLTMGQDRLVRFWDLYLSRSTATEEFRVDGRFAGPISCVEFSPCGDMLVTAGESFARVTLMRDGRIVRAAAFEGEKPVAVVWLSEAVLLIGMSSGRGATVRIEDEREPCWTRFYRDGKLTAMARVGKYLATASNRTVVTLWEILEEFRFWPLCHAEIVGKATSLVMLDAAQLGLKEISNEKSKVEGKARNRPEQDPLEGCSKQFKPTTTDLWDNSFGDTPSDDSDGSINEKHLKLESDGADESEVYQIIPETPPHGEVSSQSLIDLPAAPTEPRPQRSDSSLESLRVSDPADGSDSGSEESYSAEQIIVMMACRDRPATPGADFEQFNSDYDGDNDDSDDVAGPAVVVGSVGRSGEETMQC